MGRIKVLPFACVDPYSTEAITCGKWMLYVESEKVEEVGSLNLLSIPFDPALETNLYREIQIDPKQLALESQQGGGAEFQILVEIQSSHTGLRHDYTFEEFSSSDETIETALDIEINNCETGGRLKVLTRVVLKKPDPETEIGASIPGSIIYEDVLIFDLESNFQGFPHLEPADLSGYLDMRPGPTWVIQVDSSDLLIDATQAVTLTVNVAAKLGKDLVAGKAEISILRHALMQELCREIINAAIESSDFEDEYRKRNRNAFVEHPRSIGRMMLSTLTLCGFTEEPKECRVIRDTKPYEFHARIQNHVYSVGNL